MENCKVLYIIFRNTRIKSLEKEVVQWLWNHMGNFFSFIKLIRQTSPLPIDGMGKIIVDVNHNVNISYNRKIVISFNSIEEMLGKRQDNILIFSIIQGKCCLLLDKHGNYPSAYFSSCVADTWQKQEKIKTIAMETQDLTIYTIRETLANYPDSFNFVEYSVAMTKNKKLQILLETESIKRIIDEYIICKICYNIPSQLKKVCLRGHYFCQDCHSHLLKCPLCRDDVLK